MKRQWSKKTLQLLQKTLTNKSISKNIKCNSKSVFITWWLNKTKVKTIFSTCNLDTLQNYFKITTWFTSQLATEFCCVQLLRIYISNYYPVLIPTKKKNRIPKGKWKLPCGFSNFLLVTVKLVESVKPFHEVLVNVYQLHTSGLYKECWLQWRSDSNISIISLRLLTL